MENFSNTLIVKILLFKIVLALSVNISFIDYVFRVNKYYKEFLVKIQWKVEDGVS